MIDLEQLKSLDVRLTELRLTHLELLESSFATLRELRLLSDDGTVDLVLLRDALDFVTRTDGSLQGVLESWASYKSTLSLEFAKLALEYEHAIDTTRENLSPLRQARMSWEEQDAFCRLQNHELHSTFKLMEALIAFVDNTIYEIKARQKFLYAKRQTIELLLRTLTLQLRLQGD